jgi:hypothetical protein
MKELSRQKLETRLARVEQQIRAFKELHASELQLILDELASIRVELASFAPKTEEAPSEKTEGTSATPADPAANSPRRAAWEAEQQRKAEQQKAPLSRRELLRGRDPGEGSR